ncbi:MAG: peptide MFS transporter, partial [Paludibacteraceae bacterium]|nr:peptide MFS transporter [Paludibacteraceae bacterium]
MKGITRHPSGLYLLFTVEMWERFSYYGMRALLIFYLTKSFVDGGLGIDEKSASLIYGIFTGLVYFTPIIGGWLADRFLGQRLSIEIGAFTMMLGQFCLAAEQSTTTLFAGLTLLIIGNGFFKPNISVIVGQLYEPHDRRIDSAFTIFYMGINIGALFAPLVTGFLAETFCYRAGFMAAGIGLLLGLITYMALGNRLLGDHGKLIKSTGSADDDSRKNAPLTKTEKDRTASIFIITFFVIFFFAGFEQAGSSLSLYADKFIDRSIGSWEMPASWFQSINPLFIVLLAPLFSWLWKSLSLSGKEPSIVMKMGSGMVLLGVGFLFMVGAVSERGGSEDA